MVKHIENEEERQKAESPYHEEAATAMLHLFLQNGGFQV